MRTKSTIIACAISASFSSGLLVAAPLSILKPTTDEPNALGAPDAPSKSTIETSKPAPGLDSGDFVVRVGGAPAVITSVYEADEKYVLELIPPVVPAGTGPQSVSVDVAGESASVAGGMGSAKRQPLAVVLVIDRSQSMYLRLRRVAASAAQFLDRLAEGDMVGVVTFNSPHHEHSTTEFPLTELTAGPGLVSYFIDDVEGGASDWRRLYTSGNPISDDKPFWKLSGSAHSGALAWAMNPTGVSIISDRRLVSRSIDLSAATQPYLACWFRLESPLGAGYSKDWRVRFSTDGGSSFAPHPIYEDAFAKKNYGSTASPGVWRWMLLDLSDYAGQADLQMEFRGWAGGGFSDGSNLIIDDIVIAENLTPLDFAKASLHNLDPARGNTSIGAGLQRAASMLSAARNHQRIAIVLSDGEENYEPYVQDVVPLLIANNVAVAGIGLGGAFPGSLRSAASRTGGSFDALESLDSLTLTHSKIADQLTNERVVDEFAGVIGQGDTRQHVFNIDPSSTQATFNVFLVDEGAGVAIELTSPDGTTVDEGYAGSHDDVEFVNTEQHGYVRVTRPEPGAWTLNIASVVVASKDARDAGDISYTANATATSNLQINLYLSKDSYVTGEPVELAASVADEQPILGASVAAEVAYYADLSAPDAPLTTFVLDLLDGDNDGVYTATIPGEQVLAGGFGIELSASGDSNHDPPVPFTRSLTRYLSIIEPFRIVSISRGVNSITLEWLPSQKKADIQFSPDLVNWQTLDRAEPGTTWTGIDMSPPARGFYRILIPDIQTE